ncbi:MAG TPA: hypothetical protein VF720_16560 [Candidatus Eisenbacteria bacterium]
MPACIARRVLFAMPLITLLAAEATAQSLRNDFWVAYPSANSLNPVGVAAIVPTDSVVFIGGDFTTIGPPTGSAVAVDMATHEPLTVYPQVDGPVYAAIPDGVGGYYIGGAFSTVQGQNRSGLARIGADGRVLPWSPGVKGSVRTIVTTGGKMIVGGSFSSLGGVAASNLGAVDLGTGNGLPGWGPGTNGMVRALKLSGGLVYVGGSFTDISGLPSRDYLIALETTSGVGQAWDPPMSEEVHSLAVSGNTVYAGGAFTFYGPSDTDGIVAIDADTGAIRDWTTFIYSSGGGAIDVNTILVRNGAIYIGGKFSHVSSQLRFGVAALDSITGQPTAWLPQAANIQGITESNGLLYLAGPTGVSAVDVATGAGTGWSVTTNTTAYGFVPLGTRGVVYGAFTSAGCITRNRLAALSMQTGRPTDWNPNVNGPVYCMRLNGTTLYIGGRFEMIGGVTHNGAASFDATNGQLTSWTPSIGTALGGVKCMTIGAGGVVHIGGNFTSVSGSSRLNLAAIDPATGLATPWNPSANGEVNALWYRPAFDAVPSTVWIGGAFTTVGGQGRLRLASVDAAAGSAGGLLSWNPGAGNTVRTLLVLGNPPLTRIIAGGDFNTLAGQPRNYVGSMDQSGAATSWNPSADGPVHALTVTGTNYYISGTFTTLGGAPRSNVGIVGSNGLATTWNMPLVTGSVRSMALRNNFLYAGGLFLGVQGWPHSGFAAITQGATTGVGDDEEAPKAPVVVTAWPNPFTRRVTLRVDDGQNSRLTASIFDIRGRLVARLGDEAFDAARRELSWDGHDLGGRDTPSGVYFARLHGGSAHRSVRLVRVVE